MSVEPRGAVFADGDRMARLDMQTLSNAAPHWLNETPGRMKRTLTRDPIPTRSQSKAKPTVVPSFETMYQSKARSAQASANKEVAESASSQEGDAKDE